MITGTQPLARVTLECQKEKKEELFGGIASAPSETGSSSKEAKFEGESAIHAVREQRNFQSDGSYVSGNATGREYWKTETASIVGLRDVEGGEDDKALRITGIYCCEDPTIYHAGAVPKSPSKSTLGSIPSLKGVGESKPPQLELPMLGSLEPTQPLHSAEVKYMELDPNWIVVCVYRFLLQNSPATLRVFMYFCEIFQEAETKKRAATKVSQKKDEKSPSLISPSYMNRPSPKVPPMRFSQCSFYIDGSFLRRLFQSDTFCYCGAQSTISTTTFEGDLNDKVKVELLPTTVKPIVFDPYNPVDLTHRPGCYFISLKKMCSEIMSKQNESGSKMRLRRTSAFPANVKTTSQEMILFKGTSDMSAKCLKPVQRQANHRIIVPFLPVLHGITYASKHAQLLTELVENYEYFESNLLDSS
ncbi:unnamed protein product [Toxocara canis]|uniref:DENN domain-containing protein 4C n=1 Tax=Toxocara canis TaxID=6265 RepID=A0A183UPI2_TOXCA|nr:unnamed protein product [Toxocara canis]